MTGNLMKTFVISVPFEALAQFAQWPGAKTNPTLRTYLYYSSQLHAGFHQPPILMTRLSSLAVFWNVGGGSSVEEFPAILPWKTPGGTSLRDR